MSSTAPPPRRPPVRDDLALFGGYHSPQVDVDVRLNTNESPEGPPEEFRRRWLEALADLDLHRYPNRSAADLRAALAAHHGVGADQILIGNGSNEVLQAVCLAYGGAGRTALTFEPTYAMHGQIARITGTEVVVVERRADFTIDPAEAAAAVAAHDPALVFLCSPNNPTGLVESPDVLDAVAEASTGVVVVDEAYAQFSHWSAIERIADHRAMVVTRTFSKTWAMAALRLGYLVGPAWLVASLEPVVLPYHVDAAKQLAGRLALEFEDEMAARVARAVEQRGRVTEGLRALDVDVFPSGANFVLFRPRSAEARDVWAGLVERSVLVRDCSSWPRLGGCLRVTIGSPQENDRFLAALAEVLG